MSTRSETAARLRSATVTGQTETKAFVSERTTAFVRLLFLFVIALYVIGFVASLVMLPNALELHLSVSKLIHLVAVFVTGTIWWWSRRRERPVATTRLLGLGTTVLVAIAVTSASLVVPANVPGLVMLFLASSLIALVLVLRAAIVPSPAAHAVWVGLPSTIALAVAGWHAYDGPVAHGVSQAFTGAGLGLFSGALFTAASAVVSRTVYGLRASVREAMQLGQYTLEHKIGEGGMGAVYRARHALLQRPTAIKLLPVEKAGDQAVARFEQEVQQTARLTHPNTVAVYDFGYTDDGVFYYAMEYLDGLSLEELVALAGPLPASRAVYLVQQVADALSEAHGVGLVHRDIKPANILVCQRGGQHDFAKVVDFGLVKEVQPKVDLGLTEANVVTGTPLYLAPEVLSTPDKVSAMADIYALGAVLYFALTGAPVFNGNTLVEICGHHLHTPPEPPSERLGTELPADLEAIVLRCLAKKPAERFEDIGGVRDALLACACAADWSRNQALGWWADNAEELKARRHDTLAHATTVAGGQMLTVALSRRGR